MTDVTVVVVEHDAAGPGGWLTDELEAAGCRVDVRRPYAGDRLPDADEVARMEPGVGVVVLGGPMSAWDDTAAPWLPDVRALVKVAEAEGVPTLGVCLGHQLSALALGGEVAPNPAGATVAVVPVSWGEEAAEDPLFADILGTEVAVHWNNDIVTGLPAGAKALATSPDGAVQAARLGRHVWGVQFHPEAGPSIVGHWVDDIGSAYDEAGFDLEQYLADVRHHQDEMAEGCKRLARSFLGLVVRR